MILSYLIGDTPLHECVRKNLLDCIEKLLERGSDVNHLNHAGFSPLHLAICAGENFNIEIVKALIVKGYNTNVNLPETTSMLNILYVYKLCRLKVFLKKFPSYFAKTYLGYLLRNW